MAERNKKAMRLVVIENPTLYSEVEEYLLFEWSDSLNLEDAIGSLTLYIISPKPEYHRLNLPNRYVVTVEKKAGDFSEQQWEEAIHQLLIEEFGHRIDFPKEAIIWNKAIAYEDKTSFE